MSLLTKRKHLLLMKYTRPCNNVCDTLESESTSQIYSERDFAEMGHMEVRTDCTYNLSNVIVMGEKNMLFHQYLIDCPEISISVFSMPSTGHLIKLLAGFFFAEVSLF